MTSNSNLDHLRLPALAMSGIALIRQLWILPRLKGFSMTISGSFLGIFCHQTLKVLTWAVVAVGGPALWRLAWASCTASIPPARFLWHDIFSPINPMCTITMHQSHPVACYLTVRILAIPLVCFTMCQTQLAIPCADLLKPEHLCFISTMRSIIVPDGSAGSGISPMLHACFSVAPPRSNTL